MSVKFILTSSSFPREGRHVIKNTLSVARFTSSLRRPDPAFYPVGTGVLSPRERGVKQPACEANHSRTPTYSRR
jgi:hypothetical protein